MKVRTVSKNARVCGAQNDLHNYLGHPTRAKLSPDLKLIISENILYYCFVFFSFIVGYKSNMPCTLFEVPAKIMDSSVTEIALFLSPRNP